MAVPGRRNGVVDEDDYEEDNALFEEDGVIEFDSDTPPHLRPLATASQLGDVDGLRTALGSTSSFYSRTAILYQFYCYTFLSITLEYPLS